MEALSAAVRNTGRGCIMRISLLGAVLIVSTGCATVTSYQKPITDFATATASAESTLATLNQGFECETQAVAA